ncbi:MAG: hypothetical protein HY744_09645 [Deltaproteobacteria bacterium]|nr:hypothetical protein [Deltaproteobacteria bacterium]
MSTPGLVRAFVLCAAVAGSPGCAAGDSDSSGLDLGGGDGGGGAGGPMVCTPGQQLGCGCPGGGTGVQVCLPDGSGLGPCECTPFSQGGGGAGGSGPSEPCGNGTCDDDENCHTCNKDCGICKPCDIAPACENVQIPPPSPSHMAELDIPKMEYVPPAKILARLQHELGQAPDAVRVLVAALDAVARPGENPLVTALRDVFAGHPAQAQELRSALAAAGLASIAAYRDAFPEPALPGSGWQPTGGSADAPLDVVPPGGTLECGAPLLRIGVMKITVYEEDDDWANDIVYCVLQAEAAAGGEIRITPPTPNLDEGDSYTLSLLAGVFWGQKEPRTPAGSMMITYDCFEADTNDGYQNLVGAIGDAASKVGDAIPGDSGWIFKTAGALAPVVSQGLALDGDDHLFNAQQNIPLEKELPMTNGVFWTVRREGTHLNSDWDWELLVEAWGCAEYGTL